METILAIFGLLFLLIAAVATGLYLGGVREVPSVTIDPAPRRRQPEGLRITAVSEGMRRIRFIADPMTAKYIQSLGVGRVFMLYHDFYSGDRHYDLSVSQLTDWSEVLRAMGAQALPEQKRVTPGAMVKQQGQVAR